MRYTINKMSSPQIPRVVTFDLMRGYFLLAILLNHLYYFPNWLDWVTARGDLFVSSAEGFFFISGIVLGIVRGAKLIEQPMQRVTKLLLSRSFQLYVTSIILVFIFTFLGWWFFMSNPGLKYGIWPAEGNVAEFIWKVLTLQHFYGWADYLRLYAIFIFIAPLAVWLLRKGKWPIVLALSMGTWLLYPPYLDLYSPYEIKQLYQPLSWQLLFFSGLIVGFHWPQITQWWRSVPRRRRQVVSGSVVSLALITVAINIVLVFGERWGLAPILSDYASWWRVNYFDKERLDILRIVTFLIWFWASFWLFHRFEPAIRRWLGWLLLPFGTNSLYVYTLQAFIIFFAHLFIAEGETWMNFITAIGIVALVRLAIHYRFLMNIIPR